jgi:hypothetical protein
MMGHCYFVVVVIVSLLQLFLLFLFLHLKLLWFVVVAVWTIERAGKATTKGVAANFWVAR